MLLCGVESLVLFLILRTDLEKVVHSHPLVMILRDKTLASPSLLSLVLVFEKTCSPYAVVACLKFTL